ncbi:hypothetical protein FS749_015893 [Ceratobasidium sp. UAMH 11750]|nr:hypothetical protein FS749_015893 [Ceratobasidium sp. UAMH 11750]
MVSSKRKLQTDPDSNTVLIAVKDGQGDVEGEQAEAMGSNPSIEQDEPPVLEKKRTRHSTADSGPRKRVRGKQGGLQGLMKMPVEIFTEIAYLLTPGDLIALSWSNKFFRNMLLQRSTVKMWQRAETNVPGLPPCPVGMCEPQYAALVFTKYCTLCGESTKSKLDPHLHARLCTSCRKAKLSRFLPYGRFALVDSTLVDHSAGTTSAELKSTSRDYTIFSLTHVIDEVLEKQRHFRDAGKTKGLAKWEKNQRKVISARRKHGDLLRSYLESVSNTREEELDGLKQQRRDAVSERLKELGWTDRDMELRFVNRKVWWTLVEVPKPLTDRIWSSMLPKLIPLLEENRLKLSAYDKQAGRIARRKCVHEFLGRMERAEAPLEPIFQSLWDQLPAPSGLGNGYGDPIEIRDYKLELLIPNTYFALTWNCLVDLSERDIAVEEVKAELEVRKELIQDKLWEWRGRIEQQLVEMSESGTNGAAILTVNGSTEMTEHLPQDLRRLLRADTVFKLNNPRPQGPPYDRLRPQHESSPYYYPRLVTGLYTYFSEYIMVDEPKRRPIERDVDLGGFRRNAEVEKIVKLLLRDLGMPDATRLELMVKRSMFVCGRCTEKKLMTWDEIVEHYIQAPKDWEREKDPRIYLPIRYIIMYRNVHELESRVNLKPLVRLLTKEEAHETHKPKHWDRWPSCFLCGVTGRRYCRFDAGDMVIHLRDVHDIYNPAEGVHYGKAERCAPDAEWCKLWDMFHSAQGSGLATASAS